jgi:hypothetical protein
VIGRKCSIVPVCRPRANWRYWFFREALALLDGVEKTFYSFDIGGITPFGKAAANWYGCSLHPKLAPSEINFTFA